MAAPVAAAPDQILLSRSKTRRDLRISLALLLAGIADVVAFSVYTISATRTGNYPSSIGTQVTLSTVSQAGFVLVVVGSIFAGINWSLLRRRARNA